MNITAAALVVQKLGPRQRGRILRHFLALPEADRILRFGSSASDSIVQHYVEQIDFSQDVVYGVAQGRGMLLAVAHLALRPKAGQRDAELGISVLAKARGKGLGHRVFEQVLQYCRTEKIISLYMHCLASNQVMLHLAKKAGMLIVRDHGEADAYLQFPSLSETPQQSESEVLVAA